MKFEQCTPTYIFNRLAADVWADYGCSMTLARRLVKQALETDAVRAAILEAAGDRLAEEASLTIKDVSAEGFGQGIAASATKKNRKVKK